MSATFPETAIPFRHPVSGRGRASKVGLIAEHRHLETRPEMPPLSKWPWLRHCQVKADQKSRMQMSCSASGAGESLLSHAETAKTTGRLTGLLAQAELMRLATAAKSGPPLIRDRIERAPWSAG